MDLPDNPTAKIWWLTDGRCRGPHVRTMHWHPPAGSLNAISGQRKVECAVVLVSERQSTLWPR